MSGPSIMIVAGEASGDNLAAELVTAMRASATMQARPFAPRFFGAGGPRMMAAGVDCAFDLTQHAVVGIWDVLKAYPKFKRLFDRLVALAVARQPDVIVLVDYPGFNLRFARAIRRLASRSTGDFRNWHPKIVQYVSPQLWAWHESRVYDIRRDADMVLSLFPFEREWYRQRVPDLRVEFVGHPLCERFKATPTAAPRSPRPGGIASALLLPGSREREVRKHFAPMVEAARLVTERLGAIKRAIRWQAVFPTEDLLSLAKSLVPKTDADVPRRDEAESIIPPNPGEFSLEFALGGLATKLASAEVAIAASGTVTMECAWFGVPTVVLYKTSWFNYTLGRKLIRVPYLAMPNLLAGCAVYPEFIQDEATPLAMANEATQLLIDADRRASVQRTLKRVVESLGGGGASERAARAVLSLLD